jgi:hypothetical protein
VAASGWRCTAWGSEWAAGEARGWGGSVVWWGEHAASLAQAVAWGNGVLGGVSG